MPRHLARDPDGPSQPGPRAEAGLADNHINPAPERIAALINTRRELLEGLDRHPEWAGMEAELADVLRRLLNGASLRLLRIGRHTPASVIDKIVRYEAVHAIRGAEDLARRLADDRRCYAFFHPALPDEPLIFTEVALTHGMSSNAQGLLDPASPILDATTCRCATFYSISSCHDGLRGVPLGNALLGRVTDELARAFPQLETFATLSPVPGFRTWLTNLAQSRPAGAASRRAEATLVSLERPEWYADAGAAAEAERQLVPLCAYYLLCARRDDQPADPVARFHLRNGARLEQINWLSDMSATGMERAAGLMVNYLYRSSNPEREHDAFAGTPRVMASRHVMRLAEQAAALFQH